MQAARRMALLQAETMANLKERIATIPLSVAINADSLATWFPPVLARVASWDAVTLTLRIEDESHSLNLLRRGDVLGAVTRDPHPAPGCDAIELGTMRYVSVANPWLLDKYTTDGQVDWEAMPALRFGPRDGLQDEGLKTHVQKTHHEPDQRATNHASNITNPLGRSLHRSNPSRTRLVTTTTTTRTTTPHERRRGPTRRHHP